MEGIGLMFIAILAVAIIKLLFRGGIEWPGMQGRGVPPFLGRGQPPHPGGGVRPVQGKAHGTGRASRIPRNPNA